MSSNPEVSTSTGAPSSSPSPSLAARSWASRMVTAPSSFKICLPWLLTIENGISLVFFVAPEHVHNHVNVLDHHFRRGGFDNVKIRSRQKSLHLVLAFAFGRHDDDRNRAVLGVGTHSPDELVAIHVAHVDVGENQIAGIGVQLFQSVAAIRPEERPLG